MYICVHWEVGRGMPLWRLIWVLRGDMWANSMAGGDGIYVRARISIYSVMDGDFVGYMGSMWATDSCFEMDMGYIWDR